MLNKQFYSQPPIVRESAYTFHAKYENKYSNLMNNTLSLIRYISGILSGVSWVATT